MISRACPGGAAERIWPWSVAGIAGLSGLVVGSGWGCGGSELSPPSFPQRIEPISLDWQQLAGALEGLPLTDPIVLQDLNIRAAELSRQMGRELLSPEELAAFIDPKGPIDQLFQNQGALGMGHQRQVWLSDVESGPVAVKSTRAISAHQTEEALMRWFDTVKAEFEVGLALNHPNVMQVYHFAIKLEKHELKAILVCEYIPGHTIEQIRYLPDLDQLNLIEQAMRAFHELKAAGIKIGDAHTRNVMISSSGGTLKFVDLESWRFESDPLQIDRMIPLWTQLIEAIIALRARLYPGVRR